MSTEEKSANDLTFETMLDATRTAHAWTQGTDTPPKDLLAWVRLRQRAYDEGAELNRCGYDGELWDHESMSEWIATDLDIAKADAERLCGLAGWIDPTIPGKTGG